MVKKVPATMTAALAPWIGAALAASLGGYAAMFWVMGAVALTAAIAGVPGLR